MLPPVISYGSTEIFIFLALFARIGATFALMPTIGEHYFNTRVKLGVALLCTVVLYPTAPEAIREAASLPAIQSWLFIAGEILTGTLIGMLGRIIHAAAHMLGTIISNQAGLAAAAMFDPSQSSQGTILGNFITLTLTTILFATDMHHLLIQGTAESYNLLPAGHITVMNGTATGMAVDIFAGAFQTGVQVSMPYLALGLVGYLILGVMGRLMPQMQVFFVIVPAQILLAFGLLMISLASMLSRLLEEYRLLAESLMS